MFPSLKRKQKQTRSRIFLSKQYIERLKVNFKKAQVFPASAHQVEFERYQGYIKLDDKHRFHGAHGRLTYDLHDKNW